MCLIIASPTGKRISDKILEEAGSSNRDGGGLAWLQDGKIKFKKGLDVAGVIAALDGPASGNPWVVHFRIATHGPVCDELTHPFTIDERASVENEGEADAVLFQNGTFPSWKEHLLQATASSGIKLPEPPWSDTRAVAFICHVYGKHVLSILENNSRYLVFDAKDKKERRILLWGQWHDYESFKFSNRSTSAFNTSSSSGYQRTGSSGFGGGSENPIKAADVGENVLDDAAETTNSSPSTKLLTSGSENSKRNSMGGPQLRGSPTSFTPKLGYDCWTRFDDKGVFVRASNEGLAISE